MSKEEDHGFLSRWSRRKVQARSGETPSLEPGSASPDAAAAPVPVPRHDGSAPGTGQHVEPAEKGDHAAAEPPLTLDDVATLTQESDFSRFVSPRVSGEVRNAALKKLFSNPHFNVMDGLDIYIDDYGKPDPLPASMLRQMAQAAYLGLVEPEKEKAPPQAPADQPLAAQQTPTAATPPGDAIDVAAASPHDENPALRLQSLDDPGSPRPEPGAGEDPGRPT